ncbi:MAG: 6-phosphogluconolactonase [Planctomycetes bacterium]|nr:6-phosphogluconolactonase [Planctomycetota bacterium]
MAQNRKIVIENSADQAARTAAGLFRQIACEVAVGQNSCRIALCGGTTPRALYEHLAGGVATDNLPWSRLEIFFGDERDVPPNHPDSNYNTVQRTLLDNVPIPPDKVHPMHGDAQDLSAAAAEYEKTIRSLVPAGAGGLPRFDLILLGMGGDGHTASLFAGCPAVKERRKLVTAGFVPVIGRERLTITFPLINAAASVILLVTGLDKADAVACLLNEGASAAQRLPAANIQPADGNFCIVLDNDAARYVRNRPN